MVEGLVDYHNLLCPILGFRDIGDYSMAQLDAKPKNFLQHQQAVSGV